MAKTAQPEMIYLSNGIPVILQPDEGLVAATYWWIRVGSCDESSEEAGFAHFLEHMLFKDASAKETGRASSGQVAREIESLGGDINAYTSFDQTVYHVTCAAQHWEKVLDTFGTMAKPQRFLKEDFEREREVILEELRKNEDSPSRQLFQSLFSTTFRKHPYGRPVIGFKKILEGAKLSQLERFYKKYYVSERMGLILVGPFNTEGPNGSQKNDDRRKKALLKLLEKRFGKTVWPKRTSVMPTRPVEPVLNVESSRKSNWTVKPFDVKTPSLSFSFRVPALDHEDIPALDLLAGILGTGELSRLYRRLFQETSLVTDISGGLYVPKDPGMLMIQADFPSMDKLNNVAEEIFKELKRLTEEGPTSEEISWVMNQAESERLYSTQTVDGTAGRLGFLQFIMGDLNHDRQYLEDLRSVDAAKIKNVALKYLDYRRLSGVAMVPKDEAKFNFKAVEDLAKKYLQRSVKDTSQSESLALLPRGQSRQKNLSAKSEVQSFQLPSGIRVAFKYRPSSPVFSIHASVLGGVRLESENWGASYMMSLAWTKGTSSKDSHQVSRLVEGRAANLEGFSGRNSVGLQMTGLIRDWSHLSELFSEVLLDPVFPEGEVEHARRIAEECVRGIDEHSSRLCSKLFLETLYTHHPYGRIIYGSLESLAQVKARELRFLHQSWVRPESLVISVSGNINPRSFESWAQALEQGFSNRKAVSPNGLGQRDSSLTTDVGLSERNGTKAELPLKAPRWSEKLLGREQVHILVGGLGIELTSKERLPLQLLQTLLGGQSGRLFINLREKKSLAYTVAPVSFEGIEPGYVGTYIACAREKREEAIQGIYTVLQKLAAKGPTESEMKRAKELYLGSHAMDLQGDTALAAHHGMERLYGIEQSEKEVIKKLKAVSPKDLKRVCQKYLVEPYMVTSVVG